MTEKSHFESGQYSINEALHNRALRCCNALNIGRKNVFSPAHNGGACDLRDWRVAALAPCSV